MAVWAGVLWQPGATETSAEGLGNIRDYPLFVSPLIGLTAPQRPNAIYSSPLCFRLSAPKEHVVILCQGL